jgi:CMP-N-acetylneuraminic acid synthetase
METLAFIPARGGSIRLPRKNIMPFAGKPLIQYSISFAKSVGIKRIVVSTDDEEIMAYAKFSGAEVILRPSELSNDIASTASVARHCLQTLSENGYFPDAFITLQVTNPLRPQQIFQDALRVFKSISCDSVISVTENKHKMGKLNAGYFLPETYNPGTRTQDLMPLYYENGLIYISRPDIIMQGEIFGNKIQTLICDELYAIGDIDTQFDFTLAEHIYFKYNHLFEYLQIQ